MICGFGLVVLLGRLSRPHGKTAELATLLLAATSFPLVLYASEARGYAPALFFAVAAYALLLHGSGTSRWWPRLAFWAMSGLGILAHGSFVLAMPALLALGVAIELRAAGTEVGWSTVVLRTIAWHGPPWLFAATFYVFFLRRVASGGGPDVPKWQVGLDAVQGNRQSVILESADLLYNLVVILAEAGISPDEVWREMDRREQLYGIAEKLPKVRSEGRAMRAVPLAPLVKASG
ncbi:MAG: hypothetical protein HC834_08365 [Rhodospirillales bacterium]|nr:hypothetical protein [Rhodospirillales bacterium]